MQQEEARSAVITSQLSFTTTNFRVWYFHVFLLLMHCILLSESRAKLSYHNVSCICKSGFERAKLQGVFFQSNLSRFTADLKKYGGSLVHTDIVSFASPSTHSLGIEFHRARTREAQLPYLDSELDWKLGELDEVANRVRGYESGRKRTDTGRRSLNPREKCLQTLVFAQMIRGRCHELVYEEIDRISQGYNGLCLCSWRQSLQISSPLREGERSTS